jgi:hypothetical protein
LIELFGDGVFSISHKEDVGCGGGGASQKQGSKYQAAYEVHSKYTRKFLEVIEYVIIHPIPRWTKLNYELLVVRRRTVNT